MLKNTKYKCVKKSLYAHHFVLGSIPRKIMANTGNKLKVLSVNCHDLCDEKWTDVLNYLMESGAGIICLQDTSLTENDLWSTKMM